MIGFNEKIHDHYKTLFPLDYLIQVIKYAPQDMNERTYFFVQKLKSYYFKILTHLYIDNENASPLRTSVVYHWDLSMQQNFEKAFQKS